MDSAKLSGFIYKNAQMGIFTIPLVAAQCKDASFKALLKKQYAFYKYAARRAAKKIMDKETVLSSCEKIRVAAMIKFNSFPYPYTAVSKLARMMAFGSLAGVVDIKRKIREYSDADEDIKNIAHELLERELKNLARLLAFV